jgi:hypothetical protein
VTKRVAKSAAAVFLIGCIVLLAALYHSASPLQFRDPPDVLLLNGGTGIVAVWTSRHAKLELYRSASESVAMLKILTASGVRFSAAPEPHRELGTSIVARARFGIGLHVLGWDIPPLGEQGPERFADVFPTWTTAGHGSKSVLPLGGPNTHYNSRIDQPLIPTKIVWVNTAIMSIIIYAILRIAVFAMLRTRSHLRQRRGACVSCGYDVNSIRTVALVCPECGVMMKAR